MRLVLTIAVVCFALATVGLFAIWVSGIDTPAGPTLKLLVAGGVIGLGLMFASVCILAREVRGQIARAPIDGPAADYGDPPEDRSTN
jgi:hypothetical protein